MAGKTRVGLAGVSMPSFWAFGQEEYRQRAGRLKEVCKGLGAGLITLQETFQTAEGAEQAARALNQLAGLAVLDVATFPEGKAAGAFLDALKIPLILWSRGESVHGTHIGHNSFCGANFLAANFALKGRRVRHLYGDCRTRQFRARLATAVRLVGAAAAAAGARIGLFGEGIVPKFFDIDVAPADRKALADRWGIEFVPVPTGNLLAQAASYAEAALDKDTRDFAGRFRSIEVPAQAVRSQARLLRAIRDISRREHFASIAVRCWPELQAEASIWPCASLSALNDLGIPAACEGDPGGALDMLLASKLAEGPSTLLDIVDWDEKADTLAIWHCGPTAVSWADRRGARLIPHNVDGASPKGGPARGAPGVVDMQFATGPVTIFRTLGAVDDEFVVQGRLVKADARRICGSYGAVAKSNVYSRSVPVALVRDEILNRALPHHYTAVRGHLFY